MNFRQKIKEKIKQGKLQQSTKPQQQYNKKIQTFDQNSINVQFHGSQCNTQLSQIKVTCEWLNQSFFSTKKDLKINCKWFRKTQSNIQQMCGQISSFYQVSLDDLNTTIQVQCIPFSSQYQYCGMPFMKSIGPIILDPQTLQQSQTLFTLQKATFLLTYKQIEISTLEQEAFSKISEGMIKIIANKKFQLHGKRNLMIGNQIFHYQTINRKFPQYILDKLNKKLVNIILNQRNDYVSIELSNSKSRDLFATLMNKIYHHQQQQQQQELKNKQQQQLKNKQLKQLADKNIQLTKNDQPLKRPSVLTNLLSFKPKQKYDNEIKQEITQKQMQNQNLKQVLPNQNILTVQGSKILQQGQVVLEPNQKLQLSNRNQVIFIHNDKLNTQKQHLESSQINESLKEKCILSVKVQNLTNEKPDNQIQLVQPVHGILQQKLEQTHISMIEPIQIQNYSQKQEKSIQQLEKSIQQLVKSENLIKSQTTTKDENAINVQTLKQSESVIKEQTIRKKLQSTQMNTIKLSNLKHNKVESMSIQCLSRKKTSSIISKTLSHQIIFVKKQQPAQQINQQLMFYKKQQKLLQQQNYELKQTKTQLQQKLIQLKNILSKYQPNQGQNKINYDQNLTPYQILQKQILQVQQFNKDLLNKYNLLMEEKETQEEELMKYKVDIEELQSEKKYLERKYQSLASELTMNNNILSMNNNIIGGVASSNMLSSSTSYTSSPTKSSKRPQVSSSIKSIKSFSYQYNQQKSSYSPSYYLQDTSNITQFKHQQQVLNLKKQLKQVIQENNTLKMLTSKDKKTSSSKTQLKLELVELKKLANRLAETLTEKEVLIENMKIVNKELNKKLIDILKQTNSNIISSITNK